MADEKPDSGEDGIQVIGAGLPRTATSSLQAALMILGYVPCHHFVSDILNHVSTRGAAWMKAWDAPDKATRQAMIKDILKGYKAIVDYPCCIFLEDLMEIYPNAKVILGVRKSPQQWRNSFNQTLELTWTPWWCAATWMFPSTRFLALQACPKWEAVNRERYDGAKTYHADSTDVAVYERHVEWVKKVVPREKLLVFEPGMGWERLSGFLGKEVPEEGFPDVNDGKVIRRLFLTGAVVGGVIWMVGLGLLGASLWYGRGYVTGTHW